MKRPIEYCECGCKGFVFTGIAKAELRLATRRDSIWIYDSLQSVPGRVYVGSGHGYSGSNQLGVFPSVDAALAFIIGKSKTTIKESSGDNDGDFTFTLNKAGSWAFSHNLPGKLTVSLAHGEAPTPEAKAKLADFLEKVVEKLRQAKQTQEYQ